MTRSRVLIRKHCRSNDWWCGCCKWAVWTNGRMDAVKVDSFSQALEVAKA